MKLYREYIDVAYDSLSPREPIEWSNFWWDSADRESEKRYLLIGDSTIRMVRHSLADSLHCPVDMIGSSSNLDDILFVSQVDAFFSSAFYRKYDAIFVQMGHHGRIGRDGGTFEQNDEILFEKSLNQFLRFLSQFSNKIIVESIFDAVVPPTKSLDRWLIRHHWKKEMLDGSINQITRKKNEIAQSIVSKLSMENVSFSFLDINGFMNKTAFLHVDHIHFEPQAIPIIIQKMKEEL